MKTKQLSLIAILTIILILILDQTSKIWVKTHMHIGEEFLIFGQSWAKIKFIENEGMAFGLSFGGDHGKLFLTVFRIGAVGFLFYLLYKLVKSREKVGVVVAFSMIVAGAIGNIIDSVFYGQLFSKSPFHGASIATMFPEDGGYAPYFMGWVVDMLYFPMLNGQFPSWVPWYGGEDFEFFRPIFNIADSSIFCGICIFLIFHRDFFSSDSLKTTKASESELPEA